MNNHRKAHEDRIKDSFYSCLGEAHVNNLLEDLEENKEAVEAMQVPESLDTWFETYNAERKESLKKKQSQGMSRQFMYRAASLVGVVLVLAAVFTLSAENFRSRLISEVVQVMEETSDESVYEPAYLPSGYQLSKVVRLGDSEILFFENGHKQVLQLTVEATARDAGNRPPEVSVNSGKTMLVWQTEDHLFTFLGPVSEKEAAKIADSLGKQ